MSGATRGDGPIAGRRGAGRPRRVPAARADEGAEACARPVASPHWAEEDVRGGGSRHGATRLRGAGLRSGPVPRRRGGPVLHLFRTAAGRQTRGAAHDPRHGSGDASSDRGPEEPGARAIRGAARLRARGGRPTALAFSGAGCDAAPPARTPPRQARHPHGAQAQGPRPAAALRGPGLRADGDRAQAERAVPLLRGEEARGRAARAACRGAPGASRPADAVRRARLRDAGEALGHGLLRLARGEPGAGAAAPPAAHRVPAPGLRGADLAVVEVGAVPPPRPEGPLGRRKDPREARSEPQATSLPCRGDRCRRATDLRQGPRPRAVLTDAGREAIRAADLGPRATAPLAVRD